VPNLLAAIFHGRDTILKIRRASGLGIPNVILWTNGEDRFSSLYRDAREAGHFELGTNAMFILGIENAVLKLHVMCLLK